MISLVNTIEGTILLALLWLHSSQCFFYTMLDILIFLYKL